MNKFFLIVFGLLLIPRLALATCTGVCVQESAVDVKTGGTAPNPSLASNTTAGDALIAIVSTNGGNVSQTISGQGATWVTLADTGNSTSSGVRTKVFCGVVVTPAQTVTFSGNASSSGYLLETSKKACNFAGSTAAGVVGNAASGTSVSSYSVTTLTSLPVIIASVAHRTAEAVTFTQSLVATNTTASVPTFNGAYGRNNGINSFSASWTTSSANDWLGVAFDDQCSNNDACVQQSVATNTTASAPNTNTFSSNVTVGNTVCALEASSAGGSGNTITFTAPSGTDFEIDAWRKVLDTGASGIAGRRLYIYCGVVTGAGTTFISTVGGSVGLSVSAVEIHGYLPVVDTTAVANSGTSTVTSQGSGNITTTNAHDFLLGGLAVGNSATALIDGSTGFRPTNRGTGVPNITGDYQVVASTGTTNVSYSWTTASTAAAGVVALAAGVPQAAVENDLTFVSLPEPQATPTPVDPNKGIFYKGTPNPNSEGSNCPNHTSWQNFIAGGYHPQGCFIGFSWAQIEPRNGVFDWAAIDNTLANDPTDAYPIQIQISTGENGTPNTQAVCNSFFNGPITCQPWMASYEAVSTHFRNGPNRTVPNEGGLDACAPLLDPSPMDTNYQTAIEGLYTAFEAKYGSNPRIALVSISPMGEKGHHLSLAATIGTATYCGPWGGSVAPITAYNSDYYIQPGLNWSVHTPSTPPSCIPGTQNAGCFVFHELNGTETSPCTAGATEPLWSSAQASGATINDGTCKWQNTGSTTFAETYNNAWDAIAQAHGCAAHDNACWENLVVTAGDTLLDAESATLTGLNVSQWIIGQAFPSIAGCPSTCGGTFDTQHTNANSGGESAQVGINNRLFAHANANPPSGGRVYVSNEAQGPGLTWSNLVSPWFNGTVTPPANGGLSQMVRAFNGDSGSLGQPTCGNLCLAGTVCGAYKGDQAQQIYGTDFTKCDNTAFGFINSAINGTTGITCSEPNPC